MNMKVLFKNLQEEEAIEGDLKNSLVSMGPRRSEVERQLADKKFELETAKENHFKLQQQLPFGAVSTPEVLAAAKQIEDLKSEVSEIETLVISFKPAADELRQKIKRQEERVKMRRYELWHNVSLLECSKIKDDDRFRGMLLRGWVASCLAMGERSVAAYLHEKATAGDLINYNKEEIQLIESDLRKEYLEGGGQGG